MRNNAISSSDPQALEKLIEKVESLEKQQKQMKEINAYFRKHGTCKGFEGLADTIAAKYDEAVEKSPYSIRQPFRSYELTNNNANIRRLKQRIKDLEFKQDVGYVGWEFAGGEAVVDNELDRLQLIFEEKPNEGLRTKLKTNGFKWAPSQGVWQRQLNDNAIYAANRINEITPLSGESVRNIQPKQPEKTGEAR